jgi:DNA polymerase III sliding clamp (beta) subunit (PCNA family)
MVKRKNDEVFVKIGSKKLRMSSGEVRTFKSKAARDRFERVAQVIKRSPGFMSKIKKGGKYG